MPEPTRILHLDTDGAVVLNGPEGAQDLTGPDALAAAIRDGRIPDGHPLALAAAAALAMAAGRAGGPRELDLAHARLLMLRPDDLMLWRALTRMREVADVTPPADRPVRLRLEAALIEMDMLADETALAGHVLARLRLTARERPGRAPGVLLDPALTAPGLSDPGPVGRALESAAAEGLAVDAAVWGPADAPGRWGARRPPPAPGDAVEHAALVLVSCARTRPDGSLDSAEPVLDLAQRAARAGVPVWAVLPSALIDWETRCGPAPGGLVRIDRRLLAGHLTERGPSTVEGGPATLFPERQIAADMAGLSAANEA